MNFFINIGVFLIFSVGAVGCVYQDSSYPYGPGDLTVKVLVYDPAVIDIDPPPMHTTVYYPAEVDDYAVYYFVTGFGGLTNTDIYEYINTQIASHGYVVFASWALEGEDGIAMNVSDHVANTEWLEEHAWRDLGGAIPVFDHTAFGCHSAGCGINLKLALNRSDIASGLMNLEPNNWSVYDYAPDFYLPSFNMGSNLSLWACTQPGLNFEAWHRQLDCPKLLVESANQGHCDFLDPEDWAGCNSVCPGGTEESLDHYRETVGGMVTAFMTAYSQGDMDYLEYIADPDNIPVELTQHDADLDC